MHGTSQGTRGAPDLGSLCYVCRVVGESCVEGPCLACCHAPRCKAHPALQVFALGGSVVAPTCQNQTFSSPPKGAPNPLTNTATWSPSLGIQVLITGFW